MMTRRQAYLAATMMDHRYFRPHTINVCKAPSRSSIEHLRWMVEQMADKNMPLDKANRWLGYIQGVAVDKGLCDPLDLDDLNWAAMQTVVMDESNPAGDTK